MQSFGSLVRLLREWAPAPRCPACVTSCEAAGSGAVRPAHCGTAGRAPSMLKRLSVMTRRRQPGGQATSRRSRCARSLWRYTRTAAPARAASRAPSMMDAWFSSSENTTAPASAAGTGEALSQGLAPRAASGRRHIVALRRCAELRRPEGMRIAHAQNKGPRGDSARPKRGAAGGAGHAG
jgi:hypothetical protein